MIAACPRCTTRFRIGAERLREEGVRLRCTRCQSVFRVYPPRTEAPRRRDDPTVEAELTPPPRPPERERLVLVADADPDRAKASAATITALGLQPIVVHDGVEALLALQRCLASRALVDASIPRLTGTELCEFLKRNESLRGVHLVVTGDTSTLAGFGALRAAGLGPDAILEHADLPDAIGEALRPSFERRLHEDRNVELANARGADPLPETAVDAGAAPAVEQIAETFREPSAGAQAPASDEVARAERLARIVVSDIVLYNADRFDRAARGGDVLRELAGELDEGRALFRQRVPAEISATRDFLAEEMLRVARTRVG